MSPVENKEEIAKSLTACGQEAAISGKVDDAVRLYDAAIILNADDAIPYKLRGDCLFNLERHAEAVDSFDQAVRLRPKYLLAIYNRALTKKALGRLDEVLADLDAVLSLDKNYVQAYTTRGDVLIEFGRFEEAQADYDRAVALDPNSSIARYRQGKAALLRQKGVSDRQAIFEHIYKSGAWGRSRDPSDLFFSGTGTRLSAHSDSYLQAVGDFLRQFTPKLNAVDIGCGDFVIGSKVREFCASYVACDVVESLVSYNREKFSSIDVDFRVLDAVNEALPEGDIVFFREILQHLSNSDISKIISKASQKYRYAIVTECLPSVEGFTPNLDKITGDKIRFNVNGSGVVLTAPPFNLAPKDERQLCVSPAGRTSIVTTLYSF